MMRLHQKRIGIWMILFCLMSTFLHAGIVISDVVGSSDAPCEGSFHLLIEGTAGPFDIEIETGGSIVTSHDDVENFDEAIPGLCSGFYSVMVENTFGCINYYYVDIRHCDFQFEFNIQQPEGCNSNDGYINVGSGPNGSTTIGGATLPLHIEWSTGVIYNNASGLQGISNVGPGSYFVTVTDSGGCTDIGSISLYADSEIELEIFNLAGSCSGDNNGISEVIAFSPNGQTTNFTYNWTNGETEAIAKSLWPGWSCVTVTDNFSNCEAIACVEIKTIQPNSIPFEPSYTAIPYCYSDELENGQLVYHPQGGTPPFNFEWDSPLIHGGGSKSYLPAGTYAVTITDHCGETFESNYEIIKTHLNLNAVIFEDCGDATQDDTGAIILDPGATPTNFEPFTYNWDQTWDNDIGFDPPFDTNEITGLRHWGYLVTVTDAIGCVREETFHVPWGETEWHVKEGVYDGIWDSETGILYADACELRQYCGLNEVEDSETSTTPLGGYQDENGCYISMHCEFNNEQLYPIYGSYESDEQIILNGDNCIKTTHCLFLPDVDLQERDGIHYRVVIKESQTITDDAFYILSEDETTGDCTRSTFCFGELKGEESISCTEVPIDNDPDEEIEDTNSPTLQDCDNPNEAYEYVYDEGCDIAYYCLVDGVTERVAWIDGPEVQPCRWMKIGSDGKPYTYNIRAFCDCHWEYINEREINGQQIMQSATVFLSDVGIVWNGVHLYKDNTAIPTCGELMYECQSDGFQRQEIQTDVADSDSQRFEGTSKHQNEKIYVENFKIAPNPFTDNFTIYANNINETFQGEVNLINFLGQTVYQKKTTFDKDNSITYIGGFDHLLPGIYSLTVQRDNEIVMYEILVKI